MFFKINGVEVKTPQTSTWTLMDLSSEESGRALSGLANKDLIAQKRKLVNKWGPMSWAEASTLLKTVNSGVFLLITYPDLLSGNYESRQFYVGDRTAPYWYWDGQAGRQMVSDISFDFIEM